MILSITPNPPCTHTEAPKKTDDPIQDELPTTVDIADDVQDQIVEESTVIVEQESQVNVTIDAEVLTTEESEKPMESSSEVPVDEEEEEDDDDLVQPIEPDIEEPKEGSQDTEPMTSESKEEPAAADDVPDGKGEDPAEAVGLHTDMHSCIPIHTHTRTYRAASINQSVIHTYIHTYP